LFGSNHLYVFHHPQELSYLAKTGEQPKQVTYDAAQGEIAAGSGFDMTTEGKSKGSNHIVELNIIFFVTSSLLTLSHHPY